MRYSQARCAHQTIERLKCDRLNIHRTLTKTRWCGSPFMYQNKAELSVYLFCFPYLAIIRFGWSVWMDGFFGCCVFGPISICYSDFHNSLLNSTYSSLMANLSQISQQKSGKLISNFTTKVWQTYLKFHNKTPHVQYNYVENIIGL